MTVVKDQESLTNIRRILDENKVMFLATAVDSNPSVSSVFYGYTEPREGEFEIYFFSFFPTVKLQQINYNKKVEFQIADNLSNGIKGIQVTGKAYFVKDKEEIENKIKPLINKSSSSAFADFYGLDAVARWVKIIPTKIKYIDFYNKEQFRHIEYKENQSSFAGNLIESVKMRTKLWFRAVRAPFFTASIIPILIGAILAWSLLNEINFFTLIVTLLSGVAIQGGTNMLNDYFDHTSRNDESNKNATPFNGGSRLIQAGLMSSTKVGISALLLFAIGTIGALYLEFLIGGQIILGLLVFGVFIGLFYTADPLRIGYRGLGEFAVGIGFGPIFVLVSWYIQSGSTDFLIPFYWSIPVALLIANILIINEFQDYDADKLVGKNTLVVKLGKLRAFQLYKSTTVLAYIWILAGAFIFFESAILTLIVLITLPLAIKALKHISSNFDKIYELIPGNVMTIGIHFTVGLLLIIGFFLTKVIL
ncbi:MAG: 1,4-dihydroxy-2-naphthoate octaprenyltransferase [Candidatus Heimdallarchaeota archaeon LC_3]|nr:MAG: 1,4-dihydroxy-2-naphthoate octaprenyltransferase [Candidatus Heimdallarchaeota archaeon LC_3]